MVDRAVFSLFVACLTQRPSTDLFSQPFVKSFAMDSREVPLLILCQLPGLLGALCTVGAAMLLVWVCAAVVRSEATDDEGWVRKAQRVRRSHV